ncbi:MAG: Ig-like domain-containing protein, partial [Nocardioides sp.]
MRRRGGLIGRHRVALAANLALVLTVGTVVAYAVSADGYETHRTELNDGGIWVTSNVDGIFGRINKPIGQADGAMYADQDDNLDVVQQGAAVVGVNLTDNLLTPIDPATVQPTEGEEATIPPGAQVVMAGGSLAVVDPADGRVWAQRIDPVAGRPSVNALADASDPTATAGKAATLTVTAGGVVLVVSADTDQVVRLAPRGSGYAEADAQPLGVDLGPALSLTSVGERAVLLDGATGELVVVGGGTAALPPHAVLQQPGPAADTVVVATRTELLEIDLATGDATALADGLSGRPTAPVRLGACRYGAWSGGRGAVVTACGDDEPQTGFLVSDATDLVFRVNRDQILLNDRASGAVWDIDSDAPTRIDDWDAFRPDKVKDDSEEEQENQDAGDRQPPKAKADDLGARPGRITVLHPLDNDTAPSGRILAIRSVGEVDGPGALSIGPDGQTVQIELPPDAIGSTSFEYVIDDGRDDVSDHASVDVRARALPDNGEPTLRSGYRQREWVVASGGTLDVPVLPDWRDPRDGDPLALVSATAVGGEKSGAVARTTAAGRVRLTAPVDAGIVSVEYAVSDGVGAPVAKELAFRVQDKDDTESFAAVAEPDIVSGETGKQITIRPLGNDLPGTDPLTPEATLELAGKIAGVGGADIKTDLVEGTITFSSQTPRTYLLDYDAAYGSAPIAGGRIRVDVREPQRPALDPVAMPDQVTIFGQAATMVDVLANDVDPSGGMLVVQRATPSVANQLDVAVVQGRWVRVSARQGAELTPNPQTIRYSISNGLASGVEGELTVSQRPAVDDNTPVTQVDRVTVRAGSAITVPVLDNDFSPPGDMLRLVSHVSGEAPGELKVTATDGTSARGEGGAAFVAGRLVRFVASTVVDDVADFQVRYLATNEAGQASPGRVEITVVPAERRNQAPEPPQLEGRTVAGDTLKLRLPGVGVDPDGDAVTLLGLSSAPQLGRIVKYGANSLEYQAYPGGGGTDEFGYRVVDANGEEAVGTARVAVVPGGLPQPPLAVSDTVTVAPGREAVVDVMANDLVAGGDRVTVKLPDPPPGVRLVSETGPVVIETRAKADTRTIDVVYRLTNGIDTSQATITLRTTKDFDNPPIVYDAFGTAEDADTVTVDVLKTAYDPDGAAEDLSVTDVFVPAGSPPAEVRDGQVTVTRGDQPSVVPFRVEDADGGAATASLYVPARGLNLPYVRNNALIALDPGDSVRARLADYVVNPAGGPVTITVAQKVASSPDEGLSVAAASKAAVTVRAGRQYAGPGAVIVEVTTGTSVNDPAGLVSMLSIPVQVGDTKPILRCPSETIEVPQGSSVEVPVSAYCHVWTVDPDDAAGLAFDAEWEEPIDGLSAEASGGFIEVTAASGAQRDTRAVLAVSADGSDPGLLRFVVTGGPAPSMSPVRVSDMKSGQSRVIDLAPYLRPGVGDAEPTVLEADQITGLDVDIDIVSATEVRITTGPAVSGTAEFRVLMSDVPRADTDSDRQAEGRISRDGLDGPDAPSPLVPGNS